MALTGMEHYLVLTSDLEATRDFYQDALGMSQGFRPQLGFPGYWMYLGATLLAFKHHLRGGWFPPDPPYMEFTFLLLGLSGAWLLWRPSPERGEISRDVHESPEKTGEAGKKARTGFWQKERWAELVLLSAILTVAAGLGWWSTEIFYAKQVIYSYDTQAGSPDAKASSSDTGDGPSRWRPGPHR